MEEVKCCLLGFPSSSLGAPALTTSSARLKSASPPPPPLCAVPTISDDLRAQLHPSELALLDSVLPLGGAYGFLRDFTTPSHAHSRDGGSRSASTSGATVGAASVSLYASALRVGVQQILDRYVDAVTCPSLNSPSALSDLDAVFGQTFRQLVELAASAMAIESSDAHIASSDQAKTASAQPRRRGSRTSASASPAPPTTTAVAQFLREWDAVVRHEGLPAEFRAWIGESVWLSVLFTTAHFIAHGVVLHGRKDYFIARDSTASKTSSSTNKEEDYVLLEANLPSGISFDLALAILAAGRERRRLVTETSAERQRGPGGVLASTSHRRGRAWATVSGPSYAPFALTAVAMGAQDEVAEAVFHTIFHPSLCAGGRLAAEELVARVDAARALWSKALWMKVKDPFGVLTEPSQAGSASHSPPTPQPPRRLMATPAVSSSTPTLFHHLTALQAIFLCQRGDLWHSFVERVHGVVETGSIASSTAASSSSSSPAGGGSGGGALARAERNALLHRRAEESFVAALAEAGLADDLSYTAFLLRVADDCPTVDGTNTTTTPTTTSGGAPSARRGRTVEDVATTVLQRIEALQVHYERPTSGLSLVVTDKAVTYYQRLFSVQLGLRFALRALHHTRQSFTEALLTNTSPSAELRRAYQLLQRLLFVVSAVREYVDVDVNARAVWELTTGMQACKGVEEAKQRHDQFIWAVAEGSFLTQGSEALHHACREACRCALVLHLVCQRYGVVYWAVDGVNEVPPEVAAVLTALETRLHQDIIAVFLGHLGVASRAAERALWVRLDFNHFLSQGLRDSGAQIATTATTAATTTTSTSRSEGKRPEPHKSTYEALAPGQPLRRRRSRTASATTAAVGRSASTGGGGGHRPISTSSLAAPPPSAHPQQQQQQLPSPSSAGTRQDEAEATPLREPRALTPTRTQHRRPSGLGAAGTSRGGVLHALEEAQTDSVTRTSSSSTVSADSSRARPPASSSSSATPSTVFSVPALRTFAAAAYPGGASPPSRTAAGPLSSSTGAQVAAAIAARQAAVTAGVGSFTTSHRPPGQLTTAATTVAAIAASAAARASRPRGQAPEASPRETGSTTGRGGERHVEAQPHPDGDGVNRPR